MSSKSNASELPVDPAEYDRVIRPQRGLAALNLPELWRYRELFVFLAWRDILVRYKQTYLGIAWAVLQPFLTMVVFTVVFGKIANLKSSPVMIFAALLPWQFFANALTESSGSLVASSNMISKIYFPRLIVPASAVLSGVADFLIALVILFGLMLYYGVSFQARLLLLPGFLFVAFLAAFSAGVWLSALNVKYRDVKYIVPFFTRMGIYVCPVGFATSDVLQKISPRLFFAYSLNPLVGVIDGFRWCIIGGDYEPHWPAFGIGILLTLALAASGLLYFRGTEKTFADVI